MSLSNVATLVYQCSPAHIREPMLDAISDIIKDEEVKLWASVNGTPKLTLALQAKVKESLNRVFEQAGGFDRVENEFWLKSLFDFENYQEGNRGPYLQLNHRGEYLCQCIAQYLHSEEGLANIR